MSSSRTHTWWRMRRRASRFAPIGGAVLVALGVGLAVALIG